MCPAREADSRVARRRAEQEIGDRLFAIALSPVAGEGSKESDGAVQHGVVAILRDITKDRQASKNKSEFVAHVAHELRTPLASIRAYVELLVDGEAADEKTRTEYYETIQSSAERLGRLIDNMLNISRIEAGTVRVNKEPVAIAMIVKEAAEMLRPQAEEKGVTLTEELTPVVYRVLADRDLIHEAIVNLLSNAIKYTPTGGRVSLRMTPQEQTRRIRIEVSDTGAGIPAEDIPRMFEKFFRVEANKKLAKGTGLGLSLVKQIVENVHNGELTLASEVGKGSTFAMVLPLA
jgi:two-component system phosphate regulon sensor histidine kinase PhoR